MGYYYCLLDMVISNEFLCKKTNKIESYLAEAKLALNNICLWSEDWIFEMMIRFYKNTCGGVAFVCTENKTNSST